MASTTSNAPLVTRRAQRWLGILLVIPVTLMMIFFFILPLGNALVYSVVDFDGISSNPPFIGLANYVAYFSTPALFDSALLQLATDDFAAAEHHALAWTELGGSQFSPTSTSVPGPSSRCSIGR